MLRSPIAVLEGTLRNNFSANRPHDFLAPPQSRACRARRRSTNPVLELCLGERTKEIITGYDGPKQTFVES